MNEKSYIHVILPVKFPEPIIYSDPGFGAETGDWVDVRFGAQRLKGVVWRTGCTPEIDESKIMGILGKDQDIPKVSAEEIRFWEMIAEYYMCAVWEVFKSAYPHWKIGREQQKIKALQTLAERISKEIEKLSLRSTKTGKDFGMLAEKSALLSRYGIRSIITGDEILRLLSERQPDADFPSDVPSIPELTEIQEGCYRQIMETTSTGKPVLLEGVTGSGKTEIYARIASDCVNEGKTALIMVPEIALSRQLEDRFRGFFGDRIIVYHSKESQARRDEVSTAIRSGLPYVVLGTRSSLFLPFTNLGCIIVDEEHDSSYKQEDPAPRYNGRDAAIMLATIHKARMIMGSATPSYESLFNTISGRFGHVKLTESYYKGGYTRTVIIDTIAERKKNGMSGSLSRKLLGMIREAVDNGGQVLLFRSRRSYSPTLQCTQCGHMPKCPGCNVYLSYHKESGNMKCHYCGNVYRYTGLCPECGGRLSGKGVGTEKIEEEIKMHFPDRTVARLDSDTALKSGNDKKIIRDFEKGYTDILIGTQLITKGLDFGKVSLAAVICSDTLIGADSFRADESAVQILTQLKGRCARRNQDGLFVIQTDQPEHPVYKMLTGEHDPMRGLAERQKFNYPPFTRMTELVIRSSKEELLEGLTARVYREISANIKAISTPPVRPGIDMIDKKHIRVIRIRLYRDKSLRHNKIQLAEIAERILGPYSRVCEYMFNTDPI